jgi:hemolysin III
MSNEYDQSVGEEIANSISHGIGALLGVAGLVLLIVVAARNGSAWHIASFSIYGAAIVVLFTISCLYHALTNIKAKEVFHILDHSAIYLLIAATYTPFTLVTFRNSWGWWLFGLIGVSAVGGTVFKIFFVKKFVYLSTACYLLMGWMCLFAIKPLGERLPREGFALLAIGGILYTMAAGFYILKKIRFSHFIINMTFMNALLKARYGRHVRWYSEISS